MAVKYKDQGVVGIDIAGDELEPFDPYIPYFKVAGLSVLSRWGLV